MADDLKNVGEIRVALNALKDSVDGRFDTLTKNIDHRFDSLSRHIDARFGLTNQLLYFLGASILGGLVGGIFIFKDISALQTNVDNIKKEWQSPDGKLAQLALLPNMNEKLKRIDERLSPSQPLALDANEKTLIRKVLAPTIKLTGDPPIVSLGTPVPASLTLQAIPTELLSQLPKLKDLRYALDQKSGLILIAAAADNKVVGVV